MIRRVWWSLIIERNDGAEVKRKALTVNLSALMGEQQARLQEGRGFLESYGSGAGTIAQKLSS
jgi:hypothetical protein